MIRFKAALLVLLITSFALPSCTSMQDEDSQSEMAIEDDSDFALDGDSGDSGGESADDEFLGDEPSNESSAANNTAQSESEDLEAEFGKDDDQTAEPNDSVAENDLDKELGGDEIEQDQPQPPAGEGLEAELEPENGPIEAPAQEEKARVRDIRYMANSNGGTVIIETSKPVSYQSRLNAETQQFVIEMANVELPSALQRPFNTKDFKSRIGSINAYQNSGSDTARVVIQLNGPSSGEPVVQQEGASLVVIPPAPAAVAQQTTPRSSGPSDSQSGAGGEPLAARSLDEFLTGNQKFFGRNISLQIKDADVRDVINFLAEESGANIVMSDDVKGHISLKLRKVPWDQALVTVMRSKDLGYVRQGNILRISTLKELQGEAEAASKVLEAQKSIAPSMVQVIPVNYANLDELAKNLKPFLSKDGNLVADNRTNTIVATDKSEVIGRLQKLVKALDLPPAQVSIESKIVEAAEDFARFAGVIWGFSGADVALSNGGGANGAPINLNLNAQSASVTPNVSGGGPFSSTLSIGTMDIFGNLTASLSLAEQNSLAKVISSPRISTMNREKSTILQKGENVSIVRTRNEITGIETKAEKRTPFSLELNVTPQITADGAVIIDLDVKREFLGPITDQDLQARAVNTRGAKTKILVRNGQTAVIGGIYTSEDTESTTGVPLLMHIPVLGWLFKSKSDNRTKNELLIFLTPRILAQDESRSANNNL